jgi:hypothetical protein
VLRPSFASGCFLFFSLILGCEQVSTQSPDTQPFLDPRPYEEDTAKCREHVSKVVCEFVPDSSGGYSNTDLIKKSKCLNESHPTTTKILYAFDLMSPEVSRLFCTVKGIYILKNDDPYNSTAKSSLVKVPDVTGKIRGAEIIIPTGLFSFFTDFNSYLNWELKHRIRNPQLKDGQYDIRPVGHFISDQDSQSLFLMYVLAHEMGHVVNELNETTLKKNGWTDPKFPIVEGDFEKGNWTCKSCKDQSDVSEWLTKNLRLLFASGFPTFYSTANVEEYFAEIFALWTLNKSLRPFRYTVEFEKEVIFDLQKAFQETSLLTQGRLISDLFRDSRFAIP